MGHLRQKPDLVASPAQLRQWRVETAASQAVLADVLGIASRTVVSWESGSRPIPPLLPWALLAAEPHVQSLVKHNRRKHSQSKRRRERLSRERRARARAAAKRAVLLEAAQARRNELTEIRQQHAKRQAAFFRTAEKFARQHPLKPPPKPGASFIKPPKLRTVLGRRLRSDRGGSHNFRGRPGLALRPEDIAHESS